MVKLSKFGSFFPFRFHLHACVSIRHSGVAGARKSIFSGKLSGTVLKVMVSTFADLARMVASKYVDPNQQLPDVGFQSLD